MTIKEHRLNRLYNENIGYVEKIISSLSEYNDVIYKITSYHKININHLFLKCRYRELVEARQCLMGVMKKHFTLSTIGQMVGGYDHTTVIYSIQEVNSRMFRDQNFKKFYTTLLKSFELAKTPCISDENLFTEYNIQPPSYPNNITSLKFKQLATA